MSPTIVFVHGAFGNAAIWTPAARELALRGHRTVALDLPGHGLDGSVPLAYLGTDRAALATEPSAMAGVTTSDDVALLRDVLGRAREHGPVTLVGASRAGLALTAVANEAPELVDRLVYVTAWCCVEHTASEYLALPEYADSLLATVAPLTVGDPATLDAIRVDWRVTDPERLDELQELLLADGTRDELLAFLRLQDPDEYLAVDERATRVDAATWGRVPHSYVRVTDDRAIPPAMQDRLIAEADRLTPDNPFDVHSIPGSHVGFHLRPGALVDVLGRIAAR
ncbi:MAG TPA: alpha/beta fold hydrolase [Pseudonocardia sp.]|jgi:pimeloyl-ACP methyl ester carboxylesterase